jgi:hypothetical protein
MDSIQVVSVVNVYTKVLFHRSSVTTCGDNLRHSWVSYDVTKVTGGQL